ncbi:hypothetical protein, partial [Streptomyces pristinaespiralis]|uniref:hypothetical protein n=1 Tax=Streptomyces pristinaespiralis TaxID=38300 RepID=UPI002D21A3D6
MPVPAAVPDDCAVVNVPGPDAGTLGGALLAEAEGDVFGFGELLGLLRTGDGEADGSGAGASDISGATSAGP